VGQLWQERFLCADPVDELRPPSKPILVQQNIILALLLALTATAWWVLSREASGTIMTAGSITMGLRGPLFMAIWVVMMVAMMFPTIAPMILMFHRVQAGKGRRGEAFVSTWVFVGGYLLLWTMAGIAAYAAALAVETFAMRTTLPPAMAARLGGTLLIAAGLHQLSPMKKKCLSKCRSPMAFIMTSWRDGVAGALRMGTLHGAYCLGCCGLLMAILFPIGIMNMAAMAAITLFIFAEKTLPWLRPVMHGAAAGLALYGAAIVVVPRLLPAYAICGHVPETSQIRR
jgi:predicted metal-binding membrane protein